MATSVESRLNSGQGQPFKLGSNRVNGLAGGSSQSHPPWNRSEAAACDATAPVLEIQHVQVSWKVPHGVETLSCMTGASISR